MFKREEIRFNIEDFDVIVNANVMQYHYDKHHLAYTNNLNELLRGTEFENATIEEVLTNLDKMPADRRQGIINNAGGYYNHNLFWQIIGKDKPMSDDFQDVIVENFETVAKFEEQFIAAATTVFGSGWAWLVVNKDGNLEIVKTANQDCPLSNGQKPILTIDVWEHAYYLDFQNRRPDYIKEFMKIIDWHEVEKLYNK